MEAIWAYRDWTGIGMDSGKARCDLIEFPLETYSMVASLFSFIKYMPQVTRRIYCDSSVYTFLKHTKISKLFDEVNLVSFEKVLDKSYPTLGRFFAYPKIWAYTQFRENGFIVDTDLILKKNLLEYLDLSKNYIYRYEKESANRIPVSSSRNEIEVLVRSSKCSESFRKFANYVDTCNAGLLYFSSSKIANIVGHTLLSMGIELQSFLDSNYPNSLDKGLCWTLYEESPLVGLLETISQTKVLSFLPDSYEELSVDWEGEIRTRIDWQEEIALRIAKELNLRELKNVWVKLKAHKDGEEFYSLI